MKTNQKLEVTLLDQVKPGNDKEQNMLDMSNDTEEQQKHDISNTFESFKILQPEELFIKEKATPPYIIQMNNEVPEINLSVKNGNSEAISLSDSEGDFKPPLVSIPELNKKVLVKKIKRNGSTLSGNRSKKSNNKIDLNLKSYIQLDKKPSGNGTDSMGFIDKCPLCNLRFGAIVELQFRNDHINKCLDNSGSFQPITKGKLQSEDKVIEKMAGSVEDECSTENVLEGLNFSEKEMEDIEREIDSGAVSLEESRNEVHVKTEVGIDIKIDSLIRVKPDPSTQPIRPYPFIPIPSSPSKIQLLSSLTDPAHLFHAASYLHNPNSPIHHTTPDLFHNAKSKIKRPLPASKTVPGTTFSVDAFNVGPIPNCKAYFLSHYHSDHYGGLTKGFSHALIFASPITCRLIRLNIGVSPEYLVELELNTVYIVDGCRVTCIEANHCPGSVLFLFEAPNSTNLDHRDPTQFTRTLHTGDFRVHPTIHLHPSSLILNTPIDYLYLDTTYCNPNYAFPTQHRVITKTVKIAKEFIEYKPDEDKSKSTLYKWGFTFLKNKFTGSGGSKVGGKMDKIIAVGSYSIGKERIYLAIAHAINAKIYVLERKKNMLKTFNDPELDKILTTDPNEAQIHVVSMNLINQIKLKEYLKDLKRNNNNLKQILGIRPTGWTFSNRYDKSNTIDPNTAPSINTTANIVDLDNLKPTSKSDQVTIYGVPYSEHSSFEELRAIVQNITKANYPNQVKVVSTVNPSGVHHDTMVKYFQQWQSSSLT